MASLAQTARLTLAALSGLLQGIHCWCRVSRTSGEAFMALLRWFTKNWANTTEPTHDDLRPLELALPVEQAISVVEKTVAATRRWRIESSNPSAGTLRLTRRTRVMRYVDDVRLTFEPTPGGCRVHAESRSRVGTGDLGQNRRNIRELWAAIEGLRA